MPTQAFLNTFGGGTNGTTLTQGSGGNTGGASGDFWNIVTLGGGTVVFSTAAAMVGTLGCRMTRTGTAQQNLQVTLAADIADFVGQHYQSIPTQPSTNHVLFRGYTDAGGTASSWQVAVNTTGKMVLLAASTTVYTGTDTIPAATVVRWEYEMVSATSMRVVAYSGGTNTVLADSGVIATTLVGVTRTYRIGLLTTTTSPASTDIDNVRLGTGPGLWGLGTTARPSSLISNPGAYTVTGAGSINAAQSDVETVETSPTSYVESPAGPAGTQYTVGFEATILPNGGLTIDRWDAQDVASPIIDSKLDIIVGGVIVGTNTVALSTTWTKTTFTIASVTGDMSTLRGTYTDTSR